MDNFVAKFCKKNWHFWSKSVFSWQLRYRIDFILIIAWASSFTLTMEEVARGSSMAWKVFLTAPWVRLVQKLWTKSPALLASAVARPFLRRRQTRQERRLSSSEERYPSYTQDVGEYPHQGEWIKSQTYFLLWFISGQCISTKTEILLTNFTRRSTVGVSSRWRKSTRSTSSLRAKSNILSQGFTLTFQLFCLKANYLNFFSVDLK